MIPMGRITGRKMRAKGNQPLSLGYRTQVFVSCWFEVRSFIRAEQGQCTEPQQGFFLCVKLLENAIRRPRKWIQKAGPWSHSSLEHLCSGLWHTRVSSRWEPSPMLFPLAERSSACSLPIKLLCIFHSQQKDASPRKPFPTPRMDQMPVLDAPKAIDPGEHRLWSQTA